MSSAWSDGELEESHIALIASLIFGTKCFLLESVVIITNETDCCNNSPTEASNDESDVETENSEEPELDPDFLQKSYKSMYS